MISPSFWPVARSRAGQRRRHRSAPLPLSADRAAVGQRISLTATVLDGEAEAGSGRARAGGRGKPLDLSIGVAVGAAAAGAPVSGRGAQRDVIYMALDAARHAKQPPDANLYE